MRRTCLDIVFELAKKDERIVFAGSDLGHGVLEDFKREIPERFFMEGISEANVVGMAAGMSLEGKIVYVNTIATFLTRRCFEQVVLDLCLHNVNVRLIGNGGGLVYAPLGPTHLATEDIAILRAIPNMTILSPADADEMTRLMPETVEHQGPIYIRLAKGYDPVVTDPSTPFKIGRAYPMREGKDALVITCGICLGPALEVADRLKKEGIGVSVLHMPTVKPIDVEAVVENASRVKAVVTMEEHTITGGLGSAVAEIMAEACFDRPIRFKRIGIPDIFPDEYGTQNSLMERFSITGENLEFVVKGLLQNAKG